jgi:putative ABC transport system ATP-binding protein
MTATIQFDHVSIIARDQTLLSDVSFKLHAGEKAVLSGKSGSGKSTVLRALLGLHTPSQGNILFEGRRLDVQSIQALRRCAVYIGQEPLLAADTVREALLLPFRFKAHRNNKPAEAQLIEVLQRLQLPAAILNRQSHRISGGEKQRVALARGLLLGKNLYLLDEVTSALDAESKQAVFKVCADPQLTVLSVAHDPEWVARCDRVFELDAGRLIEVRHDHA